MSVDNDQNMLHFPGRAERLEDIYEHLCKASRLSRALWLALTKGDFSDDERDIDALRELASAVADHSSAALYIFDKQTADPLHRLGGQS
jgi:hypothetical protein